MKESKKSFLSVCSGIEAASVAWNPLGWEAVGFSEIEKFPSAVLDHHYPDVPNFGDLNFIYVDGTASVLYSFAKRISDASEKKGTTGSSEDVQFGAFCGRCSGFLWNYSASDVGLAEKQGGHIQAECREREEKSLSPRGRGKREGSSSSCIKSDTEGFDIKVRCLSGVRMSLCSCKWQATNRSSPRRLQQADGSSVAMSQMSFQMAQDKYGAKNIISTKGIGLLCGGFPCQDLSVSGKRKGLKDENGITTRSGLFYRIAELAEEIGQRWTVLENVPGLLSINSGNDFTSVVGTLCGESFCTPKGGWKNAGYAAGRKGLVEWFMLDSQYVRVPGFPRAIPQRRRRIFIIRDSGDWSKRPPIFPIREGMQRHTPPSRKAREEITRESACSTDPCGEFKINLDDDGVSRTLLGKENSSHKESLETYIPETTGVITSGIHKGPRGTEAIDSDQLILEVVGALTDGAHNGGNLPLVQSLPLPDMRVRRLTVTECERLMGFKDGYTRIPWRGKSEDKCPDGPRYKALGNSWTINSARWVGTRIKMVEECY